MGRFRKANLSDAHARGNSSYSFHFSPKYLFRNILCELRDVPVPLWVYPLTSAMGFLLPKSYYSECHLWQESLGIRESESTFNSLALSRFHTVVDYGSLSNKD